MPKLRRSSRTLAKAGLTAQDESFIKTLNKFDEYEKEQFPPKSAIFANYSLEQVAYMCKKDEDAQDEYLNRINPFLTSCVISEKSKKGYIDKQGLANHLIQSSLSILWEYKFDHSVAFVHYFKAGIKKAISYYEASEAKKYKTGATPEFVSLSNYFEQTLRDSTQPSVDNKKRLLFMLDLNSFIETLSSTDQHIIHFLKLGYNITEIAQLFNSSISSVARRVQKLREKIKVFKEKYKI